MAVSNPGTPSLSGDYQNILSQLDRQGTIAQQQGQEKFGVANAVATPVEQFTQNLRDVAQQRSADVFKTSLEDQLAQHKAAYTAESEGRSPYTQDDVDDLWDKEGLDPTHKPSIKGTVYLNNDDVTNMTSNAQRVANVEQLATQLDNSGKPEDRVKAGVLRIVGRDKNADASVLAKIAGLAKPTLRNSPTDGLTHLYDGASGEDLGPVPGANTPAGTNGTPAAKDIPSLQKIAPLQAKALASVAKTVSSDPQLKATTKDIDDLAQLKKLLNSKNPSATINIRADLARDIGGVPGGRFSSVLSSSEGTDPSISAQLGNYFSLKSTGQMSDKVKQEIEDQIDTTTANRKQQLRANLADKVNSASVDAPYASDSLKNQVIAGNYARYLEEPKATTKPSVDVHDPKTLAAVKFLQANNKNVNAKNVSAVLANPKSFDISQYMDK